MEATDGQLWQVCRKLTSDFEPFGQRKGEGQPDCSTCRWYQPLLRYGVLAWGICANPHSPRVGLLTFREQGCESFDQAEEPTDDETRWSRVNFKDRVEDLLWDALSAYAHGEIAEANAPFPDDDYWIFSWEDTIERILDLHLVRILHKETEGDFDRRRAVEEVISDIRRTSERCWRNPPRALVPLLKREAEAICIPEAPDREDKFWRRVDAALSEAL
jgi:hypothetical protein